MTPCVCVTGCRLVSLLENDQGRLSLPSLLGRQMISKPMYVCDWLQVGVTSGERSVPTLSLPSLLERQISSMCVTGCRLVSLLESDQGRFNNQGQLSLPSLVGWQMTPSVCVTGCRLVSLLESDQSRFGVWWNDHLTRLEVQIQRRKLTEKYHEVLSCSCVVDKRLELRRYLHFFVHGSRSYLRLALKTPPNFKTLEKSRNSFLKMNLEFCSRASPISNGHVASELHVVTVYHPANAASLYLYCFTTDANLC